MNQADHMRDWQRRATAQYLETMPTDFLDQVTPGVDVVNHSEHYGGSDNPYPKPGQTWNHHRGEVVQVVAIGLQKGSEANDEWVGSVIYRNGKGSWFSRRVSSFLCNFEIAKEAP